MSAESRLRGEVIALGEAGVLDAGGFERAMEIAGARPDGARWLRFARAACLVGGVLLLGAALIYFIAYNWQGMTRLHKIALIAAAMAIAAAGGMATSPRMLPGRASLTLAVLCLGALLAFVGQTYQTGADPWQLFAAWAALALPWALAAAWPPIWAIVLVLVNLAVGLMLNDVPRSIFWMQDFAFACALALLNAAAAGLAEAARMRSVGRLVPRFAATLSLACATLAALASIFDKDQPAGLAIFAVIVALAWWQYRMRAVDVPILAAGALAGIIVVVAGFVKLFELQHFGAWFLVALIVIGLSAGAAQWLRKLAAEQADEEGASA